MTPALDAAQGLTDLPDFRAGYVVKSLQHVIILYLAGTLLPVTVTRRPEIPPIVPTRRMSRSSRSCNCTPTALCLDMLRS